MRLAHDGYHLLSEVTHVARLWRELAGLDLIKPSPSSRLIIFSPDELNSFFAEISCASPTCVDTSGFTRAPAIPLTSQPDFSFSTISPEMESQVVSCSSRSYAAGLGFFRCTYRAFPILVSLLSSSNLKILHD